MRSSLAILYPGPLLLRASWASCRSIALAYDAWERYRGPAETCRSPQPGRISGLPGLDTDIENRFADWRPGEVASTGHESSWLLPGHGGFVIQTVGRL